MTPRTLDPELAVYCLKWQKIFDALVQMFNSGESQIRTILNERKLLVERIKIQQIVHESEVAFLEHLISQMNKELIVQDKLRLFDSSKLDFVFASRKKEASLWKLKLDQTEGDLAIFGDCFKNLSGDCSGPQPIGNDAQSQPDSNTLEDEVKRLKLDYNKLLLEKKNEVSALLDENKFVQHQYNLMEKDLSSKLKTKEDELRIANGKIAHLLATVEKIQASKAEKDEEVARLRSGIEEKDAISRKRNEEITRLAHELELLRKTRSASETPAVIQCTSKSTTPGLASTDFGTQVTVRKENSVTKVPGATNSGKGRARSSKSKAAETEPSEDATPKDQGRTRSSKRKTAETEPSEAATPKDQGRTRSLKRKTAETEPSEDATPKDQGRTRSSKRKTAETEPSEAATPKNQGRTRSLKRKTAETEPSEAATPKDQGRTRSLKRKTAETEPSEAAIPKDQGRTRSLKRKAAETEPSEAATPKDQGRTRSLKRKAAETEPSKDATPKDRGRTRSLKRKAAETNPSEDATPKLFSSRFKIPRLKKAS